VTAIAAGLKTEREELLGLLLQQGILQRSETQPVLSRDGSSARWMLDSLAVTLTPRGAELAAALKTDRVERIFQKGTDPAIDSYSGFFDNGHRKATGLGDYLRQRGVKSVHVAGLATDYCVKFTALDARFLGFETHLIQDASRGVNLNPGDVDTAIQHMRDAGVKIGNAGAFVK